MTASWMAALAAAIVLGLGPPPVGSAPDANAGVNIVGDGTKLAFTPAGNAYLDCETGPNGGLVAGPLHLDGCYYDPNEITIQLGDSVTWTNTALLTTHTAGAVGLEQPAPFLSGPIQPGATFTHVFVAAGTYRYWCGIHPAMPNGFIHVLP